MSNRPGTGLLALAVLVLLEGCATGPALSGSLVSGVGLHSRTTALRYDAGLQRPVAIVTPEGEEVEGSVGGFLAWPADPFQVRHTRPVR